MKFRKNILIALLLICGLMLTSCGGANEKLSRVKFSDFNGMVYGRDLSFDVQQDKINKLLYFEMVNGKITKIEKANVKLSAEEWQAIEKIILAKKSKFKEPPFTNKIFSFIGTPHAKDQGSRRFSLTFGKDEVKYIAPNRSELQEVFDLCKQYANK